MRSGMLIVPHNLPKSAVKKEFREFYKVQVSEENPNEFAEFDESSDFKAKPPLPRTASMAGDKALVNEQSWVPKVAPSAYTKTLSPVPTHMAGSTAEPGAGGAADYAHVGMTDFFPGALFVKLSQKFC
jgi:hypothetical protein